MKGETLESRKLEENDKKMIKKTIKND